MRGKRCRNLIAALSCRVEPSKRAVDRQGNTVSVRIARGQRRVRRVRRAATLLVNDQPNVACVEHGCALAGLGRV
jgi:hypothetical protein